MRSRRFNRARSGAPRRRTNQNKTDSGAQITRTTFNDVWSETFSSSGTLRSFDITAANAAFTRLAAIGGTFLFYRFTKLQLRILPETPMANDIAISYTSQLTGATDITTFAEVVEQSPSLVYSLATTVPKNFRVPKSVLMGHPQKWFPYNSSTTNMEPIQGHIHLIPSAALTAVLTLQLTGEVEFRGPTPALGADRRLKINVGHVADHITKK